MGANQLHKNVWPSQPSFWTGRNYFYLEYTVQKTRANSVTKDASLVKWQKVYPAIFVTKKYKVQ